MHIQLGFLCHLLCILLITGEDFNESVLSVINEGSVALPLPLDDSDRELPEGYLLVLQEDINGLHPSDARRIGFLNRFILVTIEDNDSKYFKVSLLPYFNPH